MKPEKRGEYAVCPKCRKGTPVKFGKDHLRCRMCEHVWPARAAQLVQLGERS